MTIELQLPHNFVPRPYQLQAFKAIDDGYKRILLCHHRRAGKDMLTLNLMIREMYKRKGYYLYLFPDELVVRKQQQLMMVELTNGSIFQLIGSDRFTNVGINPVMVVFSEFSLQNPLCWNLIRPILAENEGIAVFQGTPRGRNHFYDLYEMAKRNESWFVQRLSVEDTKAITEESIEKERQSGMSEELIQQEFYTSFSRGVEGSYYGSLIEKAKLEGRIGTVPYDPGVKVDVAFDLGMDDSTAVWFWQQVGQEVRFIDYYESSGEPISHYVGVLKEKPYIYGHTYLPHDAKVRELGTGLSRVDVFRSLGIDAIIVPNIPVMDGIEKVRGLLPRCWFDEKRCEYGIKCLEMYHKEYNPKLEVYANRPCHDRWSHGSDSMRYASLAIQKGSFGTGLTADEWDKTRRKYL